MAGRDGAGGAHRHQTRPARAHATRCARPVQVPSGGYGDRVALEVGRDLAAPAAVAWDVLVDTTRWPDWGPTVAGAEITAGGDGPRIGLGTTGAVRTPLGLSLSFRITELDPGRRWAWAVGGVAATAHRVEALGASRCRVTFEVPRWAAPYLAVCAVALRRLERLTTT